MINVFGYDEEVWYVSNVFNLPTKVKVHGVEVNEKGIFYNVLFNSHSSDVTVASANLYPLCDFNKAKETAINQALEKATNERLDTQNRYDKARKQIETWYEQNSKQTLFEG